MEVRPAKTTTHLVSSTPTGWMQRKDPGYNARPSHVINHCTRLRVYPSVSDIANKELDVYAKQFRHDQRPWECCKRVQRGLQVLSTEPARSPWCRSTSRPSAEHSRRHRVESRQRAEPSEPQLLRLWLFYVHAAQDGVKHLACWSAERSLHSYSV